MECWVAQVGYVMMVIRKPEKNAKNKRIRQEHGNGRRGGGGRGIGKNCRKEEEIEHNNGRVKKRN